MSDIILLWSKADVTPFIPMVVEAADKHRHSFGFLPARAYDDFALQQRLIVACDRKTSTLAGYIVFGGTQPQARIFQTYVAPDYRGSGIGRRLVDEVVRRSEEICFLSIRAEVASDLDDANAFYRNLGFRRVRDKAGGSSRNRVIHTRVRELQTPSLLDFTSFALPDGPAVSLKLSATTRQPLYLIDLNVLFDLTKRRSNALGAGRVLAAAVGNSVTLAVASEFVSELERTTDLDKPDPILEIARAWPRLRPPPRPMLAEYSDRLASRIFRDRWSTDALTVQDKSDIIHLATAIEEGADGFITSEKAILAQSDWFRKEYRIDVTSPSVFGERYTATARNTPVYQIKTMGRSISTGEIADDHVGPIKKFLADQDVPDEVARESIFQGTSTSPRRRVAVWSEDGVVAFASWPVPKDSDRVLRIYIFANEADGVCPLAVDYLLELASREASVAMPRVIEVNPPADQVVTRTQAIGLGFRPRKGASARAGWLEKMCLGAVVTEANWPAVCESIQDLVGVVFPETMPSFGGSQFVLRSSDGKHAATGLCALEDFVSPAIFAVPGRPAVIVPIRSNYAEALFRGSLQPSFLDDEQAALLRSRRYFGDARTYQAIADDGLIFFYESARKGGRSAVVAMARISRRYLAQEGAAKKLSAERGVLSAQAVKGVAKGEDACVTEFDTVMIFSSPVPLAALKAMGAADGSNMVTARAIGSEVAAALIKAGEPKCVR